MESRIGINGFGHMGRLGLRAGPVLSGWVCQSQGLTGCLWWSAGFVQAARLLSFKLPELASAKPQEGALV